MTVETPAYPKLTLAALVLGATLLAPVLVQAATDRLKDPHYTDAGFFDIHVCNWPDQPLFFKTLFSTYRFQEIESIRIFYPDGSPLGQLGLDRFRVINSKGKPEKRVFMADFDVPAGAPDGIYRAQIQMKDGKTFPSRDKVVIQSMARINGMQPSPGGEVATVPEKLSWQPVKDGSFYKVFVRDMWQDGKLVFESKLIQKPQVSVPAGILEPGGFYSWRIHARDVNEDIHTGDFNHGSVNREATFTIAD